MEPKAYVMTQAHRGCFDLLPSKVVARVPDGAIQACSWAEAPNGAVQEALFVRYGLMAAAEVRIKLCKAFAIYDAYTW